MHKTKEELFEIMDNVLGIKQQKDAVKYLHRKGFKGLFDPNRWNEYMEAIGANTCELCGALLVPRDKFAEKWQSRGPSLYSPTGYGTHVCSENKHHMNLMEAAKLYGQRKGISDKDVLKKYALNSYCEKHDQIKGVCSACNEEAKTRN